MNWGKEVFDLGDSIPMFHPAHSDWYFWTVRAITWDDERKEHVYLLTMPRYENWFTDGYVRNQIQEYIKLTQ